MVGSTQSISDPNVVLNTIVADSLAEVCDQLEKVDGDLQDVMMEAHELTKKMLTDHQRVIFNGDGYSEAWVKEAERRGLPNIRSMVEAIPALITEKSVKMFEKFGVFTKAELESRVEILFEQYAQTINIEALATLDIAKKQIVPAVMKYQKTLADSVAVLKATGMDTGVQESLLGEITENLKKLYTAIGILDSETVKAQSIGEVNEQARFYHNVVFGCMMLSVNRRISLKCLWRKKTGRCQATEI